MADRRYGTQLHAVRKAKQSKAKRAKGAVKESICRLDLVCEGLDLWLVILALKGRRFLVHWGNLNLQRIYFLALAKWRFAQKLRGFFDIYARGNATGLCFQVRQGILSVAAMSPSFQTIFSGQKNPSTATHAPVSEPAQVSSIQWSPKYYFACYNLYQFLFQFCFERSHNCSTTPRGTGG